MASMFKDDEEKAAAAATPGGGNDDDDRDSVLEFFDDEDNCDFVLSDRIQDAPDGFDSDNKDFYFPSAEARDFSTMATINQNDSLYYEKQGGCRVLPAAPLAPATSSNRVRLGPALLDRLVPTTRVIKRMPSLDAPNGRPGAYSIRGIAAVESGGSTEDFDNIYSPTMATTDGAYDRQRSVAAHEAVNVNYAASTTTAASSGKKWCRLAVVTAMAGMFVTAASVLGVVLTSRGHGATSPQNFSTTRFDRYTRNCSTFFSQASPHVITQCHCSGNVFKLAPGITARYEELTKSFVPSVDTNFSDSIESCDPRNQALVWLASVDGFTTNAAMRQRYTMALLFILWNGPSWNFVYGWLTSANECAWYGVTCNKDLIVTKIDLSRNNLVGQLTEAVSLVANLTSLALDSNDFQHSSIPSQIGVLTNLITLTLSKAGIIGSIPNEVFKLGDVLEVFRVDNGFTVGNVDQLESPPRNQLTGTIPTEIGRFTKMSDFRLGGNIFRGTIPTQVGNVASLVTFYVNDNQLTGTIPEELGNCSELLFLSLRNNSLNGSFPNGVGTALESLDLSLNQITGTTPQLVCDRGYGCVGCNCSY